MSEDRLEFYGEGGLEVRPGKEEGAATLPRALARISRQCEAGKPEGQLFYPALPGRGEKSALARLQNRAGEKARKGAGGREDKKFIIGR